MEANGQSALHRCHQQAQGHLRAYSGWQLPAWYTEPAAELAAVRASVGISDASHLTKLNLRGSATGLALPPPARVWQLTSSHSLVTSSLPIAFAPSSSVTEVTSVYSAILLAGPKSRDLLQKLTTLNVRAAVMLNGAARLTRLAHVNATVLRFDSGGLPGFLIFNTRDLAEFVWETLLHAGEGFNARPFGMVAQQQWMDGAS